MFDYLSGIYNTIARFQETNQYVDLIVIALVLLGGYFSKQYLTDLKMNTALKTLMVSTVAVVAYTLIMRVDGGLAPGYLKKAFISYAIATSLYEIIIKHLVVVLNLVWKTFMERAKNKSATQDS